MIMLKSVYHTLAGAFGGRRSMGTAATAPPDYGTVPTTDDDIPETIRRSSISSTNRRHQFGLALRNSLYSTGGVTDDIPDFVEIAESVFSDIRSESEASQLLISNEAEEYGLCTAYQRAFPERSFALFVTLLLELPTLFMISGGSDRLCGLIGRRKYTTLISLLPIISAVSGNVGLQASTLTTRAISHRQLCVDNYSLWLQKEVTAAAYLGCAMGLLSSSIAFCMGGFHVPFAFSIFMAQLIGIFTAGVTGTLAPLIFTFIFDRDSGKWGGPLETAVQDIVGSFAMIVVTYWIMRLFGPYHLESNDMC